MDREALSLLFNISNRNFPYKLNGPNLSQMTRDGIYILLKLVPACFLFGTHWSRVVTGRSENYSLLRFPLLTPERSRFSAIRTISLLLSGHRSPETRPPSPSVVSTLFTTENESACLLEAEKKKCRGKIEGREWKGSRPVERGENVANPKRERIAGGNRSTIFLPGSSNVSCDKGTWNNFENPRETFDKARMESINNHRIALALFKLHTGGLQRQIVTQSRSVCILQRKLTSVQYCSVYPLSLSL